MASSPVLFVDGQPATIDDLAHQALVNYGAYTSFRVEGGGVRGLDLHLQRLDASAVELFGEAVGEDRLRDFMSRAVAGRPECWLRISLFAPEISMRQPVWTGRPKVMIGVFDPPPPLAESVRAQVQTYGRETPHLKHAATFGLMRARREARAAGFDDALFVDADDRISEGSVWNVGFVLGDRVIWPRALMLAGVAQSLIERGLPGVGLESETRTVRTAELEAFDGAFLCNSATPACPLVAIGGHRFETSTSLIERLRTAWASNPAQPI